MTARDTMRMAVPVVGLMLLLPAVARAAAEPPASGTGPAGHGPREFRFTYAGAVTGLAPGEAARVWLPVAPSNAEQTVTVERRDLPAGWKAGREGRFGDDIVSFEAGPGADGGVAFSIVYHVTRKEAGPATEPAVAPAAADLFLQPDARVPVGGKPLELLRGKALPAEEMKLARVLYDLVDDHMVYGKDKPGWGNGDAAWACESRSGNCTDFHSLFISLARARGLPARFEMGFPLPDEPGRGDVPGYHCWARVRVSDGAGGGGARWVPVDISEANRHPALRDYYFGHLGANRVAFSTGRDLVLEPKQAGPPLNYFIYPYVEVAGKPWPGEKVKRRFSFEDVGAGGKGDDKVRG